MIETPFLFEEKISDADFQTIGKLALRWAHIEHILGNCLKVLLRLSVDEAVTIVFPMSLDERLQKIKAIAKLNGLTEDG